MKGVEKVSFAMKGSTTASYHRLCIKHVEPENLPQIYMLDMSTSSVLIINTFSRVSPLIDTKFAPQYKHRLRSVLSCFDSQLSYH